MFGFYEGTIVSGFCVFQSSSQNKQSLPSLKATLVCSQKDYDSLSMSFQIRHVKEEGAMPLVHDLPLLK